MPLVLGYIYLIVHDDTYGCQQQWWQPQPPESSVVISLQLSLWKRNCTVYRNHQSLSQEHNSRWRPLLSEGPALESHTVWHVGSKNRHILTMVLWTVQTASVRHHDCSHFFVPLHAVPHHGQFGDLDTSASRSSSSCPTSGRLLRSALGLTSWLTTTGILPVFTPKRKPQRNISPVG